MQPRSITFRTAICELLIIAAAVWFSTSILQDWSPNQSIRGTEYSYLVGSGAVAQRMLQQTGALSLWNPLMGWGEPLLENPFSYVLNPLMFFPILAWGAVQGGKIMVLLHLILMGIGGWALGHTLGLRSGGRLLLGLLLGLSGSVAGAVGEGFLQMGLSQTYIPWVMLGLIGVLYQGKRWHTGVLVVASALMIFTGTFWYILPVGISAALLCLFAVMNLHWTTERSLRFTLNRERLQRLGWALLFTLLLIAVRLLPQIANYGLINHPTELLLQQHDLGTTLNRYFSSYLSTADQTAAPIYYHYILPILFVMLLILYRVATLRFPRYVHTVEWRVIVPAALIILLVTVWAQERTPFLEILYQFAPFTQQWRFVGRMMAVGSFWLAVAGAIWFDRALQYYGEALQTTPREDPWGRALVVLNLGALCLGGFLAVQDVSFNYQRVAGVKSTDSRERPALEYLRLLHPTDLVMVRPPSFFDYLPFYELGIRTTFGNPDYRPLGLPATIGQNVRLSEWPEYAVAIDEGVRGGLAKLGYAPVPGTPREFGVDNLFRHPDKVPYAFRVGPDVLQGGRIELSGHNVLPVDAYFHGFDDIEVHVQGYQPGEVLVISETAYPGWSVTINGLPAPVESFAGLFLGVRLPEDGAPAQVLFVYDPPLLKLGGLISLLAAFLLGGFLLRAERYVIVLAVIKSSLEQRVIVETPPLRYQLKPLTLFNAVGEIGLILICAFIFSSHLQNWSPDIVYGGRDYHSAMHQNSLMWEVFRTSGRITTWDPFIGWGEPMLENFASQALNPLLIFPVLTLGPVQGGKVALFLAIIGLGLGGWLLGRVLRLSWAGRILAGLLFVANGSIVTQFGNGFTHLAFGQLPIPFALAGLIGTLYLRRRWCIVMLALSAAFMPYAGGMWYALPTAIISAGVAAFALVRWDSKTRQVSLHPYMVQRLVVASVIAVGLYTIEILPLQHWLTYHPNNWATPGSSFGEMLMTYFSPTTPQAAFSDSWINYHYVIPLAVVIGIVILRLLLYRPVDDSRRGVARVLIPLMGLIIFFTLWAMGDVPLVRNIYKAIPILEDWKNSGRIGAAATPLIIMFAAIWFDDIVFILSKMAQGVRFSVASNHFLAWWKERPIALMRSFARPLLVIVLIGTFVGALDALSNWKRLVYIMGSNEYGMDEYDGLNYLRSIKPSEFISALTQGWTTHLGFVTNRARTTHGDATIFVMGMPSTIGFDSSMQESPEYAVGGVWNFTNWLQGNGYIPFEDSPQMEDRPTAWYNPESPPYAFSVDRALLTDRGWEPLRRKDVSAVTYFHRINQVEVQLEAPYPDHTVVVITETAYPGWNVTVDGQSAKIESVGGRLAVLMPSRTEPGTVRVVFDYRPPMLYLGGYIVMLTAFLSILYLLKIDRRIPQSWREKASATAEKVSAKVIKVMSTPDLLNLDPEGPERKLLPAPRIGALPAPSVPEDARTNGNGTEKAAENEITIHPE